MFAWITHSSRLWILEECIRTPCKLLILNIYAAIFVCVNMTTNAAQVSVYDPVTSGRDLLAQYKPITKATCISSLVCVSLAM